MKRLLTWLIALAILGFFCGSYILVKQHKPKITVVI